MNAPRALFALAVLSLCALPAPAAAALRAVFVGVDIYRFGQAQAPGSRFDNLSGAVSDTMAIRAALAKTYGLPLDEVVRGRCPVPNKAAVTTTLINECATRAAIMAAWNAAIDGAAPNDTLVLYFAGHGSTLREAGTAARQAVPGLGGATQASGYNSTIMASDARDPSGTIRGDILDSEVRLVIDRATARGVRVLTIFDSCNSGTASRDGTTAKRWAPPLIQPAGTFTLSPPSPAASMAVPAATPGWRAHLGASADGQSALERGLPGARSGLFTAALVKVLAARPQAALADIAAAVAADVVAASNGQQVPQAEGALRARINGPEVRVPTFAVALSGAGLMMAGGGLVGVTPGSRFALFASSTAATNSFMRGGDPARDADQMLLMAQVAEVGPGHARLEPIGSLPANLPANLVAREVEHRFKGPIVRLAVAEPAALPVLAQLPFVAVDQAGPFRLQPAAGGVRLLARSGQLLVLLPPATSADFAWRLAAALEKIARVESWLGGVQQRPGLSLCVRNDDISTVDAGYCDDPPAGGASIAVNQLADISVGNNAGGPRFLSVLVIDEGYGVTQVLPMAGGRDPALPDGRGLRSPQSLVPYQPATLTFVALGADAPIDASVLEQAPVDNFNQQTCLSSFVRLYCREAGAARAGTLPVVKNWSLTAMRVKVVP